MILPRKATKADVLLELLACTKQRDAAWDALSEIHEGHGAHHHVEPERGPSESPPCEIHARGLGDMP